MSAFRSKQCSVKPTANSDLVLKYSCSLNVTNPEKLQLELKPTYNAKVFKTSQHSEWARDRGPNIIGQDKTEEATQAQRKAYTRTPPSVRVALQHVPHFRLLGFTLSLDIFHLTQL